MQNLTFCKLTLTGKLKDWWVLHRREVWEKKRAWGWNKKKIKAVTYNFSVSSKKIKEVTNYFFWLLFPLMNELPTFVNESSAKRLAFVFQFVVPLFKLNFLLLRKRKRKKEKTQNSAWPHSKWKGIKCTDKFGDEQKQFYKWWKTFEILCFSLTVFYYCYWFLSPLLQS